MKSLFRAILSVAVFLVFNSCLVSRAERPFITGYVYDSISGVPLKDCKVGDTYTDSSGYYELDEKRYRQFTFPGMEAPPVLVNESVTMEGYQNDTIIAFSPFGGGIRKGTIWAIDTIYMVKK